MPFHATTSLHALRIEKSLRRPAPIRTVGARKHNETEDGVTDSVHTYRIAVIPGDGIGTEVTSAATAVLDAAAQSYGFSIEWTDLDWSCARYLENGEMMPSDGLDILSAHDAIFLGAVGDPRVSDHVSLWGLLIPIRQGFEQYVNLRPVRLLPGVESPLAGRSGKDINIVIVRENCEGEYSRIGGRHKLGTGQELAAQESVFTRRGVERVIRFAFQEAARRRGQVTSATKSNGLLYTMPFWDEIFAEVAAEYRDVPSDQCHVDALAARFVLDPQRVDVVVASNLFGDILSDLAAAIAGSLGLAPSGNINPERTYPSMFESVHGSAPDIAGMGIANPVAQILAGAMMLRHLGEVDAADAVASAVEATLTCPDLRTRDLGGSATTSEVAAAVAARIGRSKAAS